MLKKLPAALFLLAEPASAGQFDDAKLAQLDPAYVEECGTCHIPYPAPLLNAKSWKTITEQLDQHFKVDASADPETLKAVNRYLQAQGSDKLPPAERITRATWFVSKHNGLRGGAGGWPKVKSLANCAACHPESGQGHFRKLVERHR